MTDGEKAAREAMAAMDKSRTQVMECEEEIKSIKNSLKSLTGFGNAEESALNCLEVSVHKVKAAGDDAGDATADDNNTSPTTFKLHLSSPIEERTITQLYDPLNSTAEEGLAKFESVETANALLTVEVYSKDESKKLLGVSAPHDLLPLCQDLELWKKGGEKKTSTLVVAIVAEQGIDDVVVVEAVEKEAVEPAEETEEEAVEPAEETEESDVPAPETAEGGDEVKAEEEPEWEDAVDEELKEGGEAEEETPKEEGAPVTADEKEDATVEKEDTADKKNDEIKESPAGVESEESKSEPAQDESKTSELQLPLYTLTIQLEYTPSPDDKRDAFYEQLNEVSKRKVAAIESLRKNASIINRAKALVEEASGSTVVSSTKRPAVKPGFLNKSPKALEEKPPPFWKRWYAKTIGPASMLWVVGPIAKNYVLFAGVSLFIHFKGDLLALPPPV